MSEEQPKEIDTANHFLVGAQGPNLVFLLPVERRISKERALNLAAYLVALCDSSEDHEEFKRLLEAIEST